MTDKNNKKANVLITFTFPNNSDFKNDVDSEILIQNVVAKIMHKFVKEGKISHFIIANDDIISEKLSN